jgi:hypothetical protein
VVIRATEEWLRMQAHPRIYFVSTNTGERRAALLSGPQVWTVAASWRPHAAKERKAKTIADALEVLVVDVEAALTYWAVHREEIDRLIEVHEADQDAALRAWEQRQALRAV